MSKRNRAEIQRQQLWAAVEAELGEAVICQRCGTTLKGFADSCVAALDDACEGFRRVDEVRGRALQKLRAERKG